MKPTTRKERVQAKRRQRDARLASRLQARGWLRPEKAEAIIARAHGPVAPSVTAAGAVSATSAGRPKASGKRRFLRVVIAFAAVGAAAGAIGLAVGGQAKQTGREADKFASVFNPEPSAPITPPTSGGAIKTDGGPAMARLQAYLDAQNTLTSMGSVQARRAAAEFVSPAWLAATGAAALIGDPDWNPSADQGASGAAPLSLAVSEASGSVAFRADPACAWSPAPTPETAGLAPVTLALCEGAGGEVYGWAELTWQDDLISAIHVGWSSARLRQEG